MKKLICFIFAVTMLIITGIAFAADPVTTTAAAATAPATTSIGSYFQWFKDNWGVLSVLLLAIEQVLAATSLKSNSTFQMICNFVNALVAKKQGGGTNGTSS
jgi:hypothetical protein